MSTISVKVPFSGSQAEREGWLYNVSQHIDAGNDVEFIDVNDSSDIDIGRIQLDTDGTVCIWGKGYISPDAQSMSLLGGGFHSIGGIHGIRAADTETGLGIHVKI
jgi:hypothetical protein